MMFFDEKKTMRILKHLIDWSFEMLDEKLQVNSGEKLRGLRWWLTFTQDDWEKFIQSFYDLLSHKSSSIKKGWAR